MFTLRGERNSRGSDLLVCDHKGVGYALIMSEMVTFEQDMTQQKIAQLLEINEIDCISYNRKKYKKSES